MLVVDVEKLVSPQPERERVMKSGAHGRIHAGYSSRWRWASAYVVMVVVVSVFGCGILGLLGLHSLRERHSLSLLIKQKDDQILSLHHLLQKEGERIQKVKRKTEEMKMEIMSLGSQKAELNRRILDMQSTISSLREEQRAVEISFQEKQNEVKLLREKDQAPRVEVLMEELRHKDTEIEDLKRLLQLRGAEVGAVRDHEHSTLPSNATADNGGGYLQDAGVASRFGETDTSKDEIDRSSGNGGTDGDESGEKVDQERERREKKEHEEGKIADLLNQVQKSGGEDDGIQVMDKGQRSSDNKEVEVHEGRMKLERLETTHRVGRLMGKRWRSIATQTRGKRTYRSNAASTMADEEKNSEISEERPPRNELSGNIQREDADDLKNSRLEELGKKSGLKEDTGLANKNTVQYAEENEHPDIKPRGGQQHTALLERKEGKPDAVRKSDSEESWEKTVKRE